MITNNLLDYSGKVALVTGAASGMGLATALAFSAAGAAVVLADNRENAEIESKPEQFYKKPGYNLSDLP